MTIDQILSLCTVVFIVSFSAGMFAGHLCNKPWRDLARSHKDPS